MFKENPLENDCRKYMKQVFFMIWGQVPEPCAQYFVWASQQKVFYVGKANVRRQTSDHMGVVARFKEHVHATFKAEQVALTVKRYRVWKNARPEELFMVVSAWHDEKNILAYERFLIHHLQAPIQDRVRAASFKPCRERPWPRLRSSPTDKHEIRQNVAHELCEVRSRHRMVVCKGLPGIPDWVTDFDGLCRWQESVFGRSRLEVAWRPRAACLARKTTRTKGKLFLIFTTPVRNICVLWLGLSG